MSKFVLEENARKDVDKSEKEDEDEDDFSASSSCSENPALPSKPFIDLRRSIKNKINRNEIFYSFEIISAKRPKTFYRRLLLDMDKISPLFYSLTWLNNATCDNSFSPLDLIDNFPSNTLLHLPVKGLKRNKVIHILKEALAHGIMNIFAIQGDSLVEDGDFKYAADLVAFIRENFGNLFCICVTGYPHMHPESVSKKLDLHYLKTKVEAGADFIITQICFESQVFIDFVKDCRSIGIQIPILPGILVLTDYECLEKIEDICKINIPSEIKNDLAQIKDDDELVRKFIIDLTVRIITDIIKNGCIRGFHLFTLNRLSLVEEICKRVKLSQTRKCVTNSIIKK